MRYYTSLLLAMLGTAVMAQSEQNRGIGLYPGNPKESFAPTLQVSNDYRNVALHRAAYHSSATDYNLTGQLVTDGIIETKAPAELLVSTNSGKVNIREKEWSVDWGPYSTLVVYGEDAFVRYQWRNMKVRANRVTVTATVAYADDAPCNGGSINAQCTMQGAGLAGAIGDNAASSTRNSVYTWDVLPGKPMQWRLHSDPNKQTDESTLPAREVEASIDLQGVTEFDDLTLRFLFPGAVYWTISDIKFWRGEEAVPEILPSNEFRSVWVSDGGGEQWVKVDLGTVCEIDEVRLHWIEPAAECRIETSIDGESWTEVPSMTFGNSQKLSKKESARHVRLVMTKPANGVRYALSEIEVMGRGGLVAVPHEELAVEGNTWSLSGGDWKLCRLTPEDSRLKAESRKLKAGNQITATVPATVLMSYVNAGALPNPNYADNLFHISESFFNADFLYTKTFRVPQELKGEHLFLNFDGINWKADIFLNGKKIDRIEGAFMRGRTDVTKLLKKGDNVLEVLIHRNAHPAAVKEKNEDTTDKNGGLLGADNPTFHATVGWDWISTIRGRDIGIWNDVYLTAEGSVTLKDPLVTSIVHDKPEGKTASMYARAYIINNEKKAVSGTLEGWIGDIRFAKEVTVPAGQTVEEVFSPEEFPLLRNQEMRLWWPNGYGEPYLYDAGFRFNAQCKMHNAQLAGAELSSLGKPEGDNCALCIVHCALNYKAGIREVTFADPMTKLTLYVNGVRVTPLGGNWGFSENNLCYRGREYDIAVRNHRDMNFNMIRNWVGQTGDKEFYEACDRYGIMVWQDFWLANPADGPDPYDDAMFLRNADDYIKRIRQHASIALYCGRNEGDPPATLNQPLADYVEALHPGMLYIPNSADYGVSGHGPYWALPTKEYFEKQTGLLHSERGMPNIMSYEGLKRTLRPEHLWPQSNFWGQHDFTQNGAQRGSSFNKIIEGYGKPTSAEEFCKTAQFVNYEGYRAMYEASNTDRMGLIIWMSHACWPSMVWQTYDYYFEPTAAFFGAKKACEPLHIQYNPLKECLQVVNRLPEKRTLTAEYEMYGMSGMRLSPVYDLSNNELPYKQEITVEGDSTTDGLSIPWPDGYDSTLIVRLRLKEGEKVVSENTYLLGPDEEDPYYGLRNHLKKATLSVEEGSVDSSGRATVVVKNTSSVSALLIRLNLKGADGEQILPVSYSDNYFHLMPGESRTIEIKWDEADARGQEPHVECSWFNE